MLRPRTQGYLSLLVQRKVTERKHARMARIPPALRASGTAVARRHIPVPAGDARHPCRAPSGARPEVGDARARHTGFKKSKHSIQGRVFSNPRSARRVPQPEQESSSEPLSESSRVVGGRRVGERLLGRGTQGSRRALRGGFLLVTFLCPSKEKSPRVQGRSHPHIAFQTVRGAHTKYPRQPPSACRVMHS